MQREQDQSSTIYYWAKANSRLRSRLGSKLGNQFGRQKNPKRAQANPGPKQGPKILEAQQKPEEEMLGGRHKMEHHKLAKKAGNTQTSIQQGRER